MLREMFSKHTEQEAHSMSTTQQRVTDEAIRGDLITPPTPKSNSRAATRLIVMQTRDAERSVLEGATGWVIQREDQAFMVYVNQGKVVAAEARARWAVGKPWSRVKPWFIKNNFKGTPCETIDEMPKTQWRKPTNSLDL